MLNTTALERVEGRLRLLGRRSLLHEVDWL
jgi:hypothetical protein